MWIPDIDLIRLASVAWRGYAFVLLYSLFYNNDSICYSDHKNWIPNGNEKPVGLHWKWDKN